MIDEKIISLRLVFAVFALMVVIYLGLTFIVATKKGEIDIKAELALADITCPQCVYVPKGLKRLEDIRLAEGPTVSLPTQEYLTYLTGVCSSKQMDFAKSDCSYRLSEIRLGVDDVYTHVSPPYGRPPLTADQLKYVQWGARRVGELLASLEYNYVSSELDYYLQNKYHSK